MRIFIAAAAMFVAPAPSLIAQTSISAAGGISLPVAGTAQALSNGYTASVALTSKPPLASVAVRLELAFNSFDFKDSTAGTGALRVIGGVVSATVSQPETPFRPLYLIAGVGVYDSRSTLASGSGNTDLGFSVGTGINLTTGVATFLEARYHHVTSERQAIRFLPVMFGLRF